MQIAEDEQAGEEMAINDKKKVLNTRREVGCGSCHGDDGMHMHGCTVIEHRSGDNIIIVQFGSRDLILVFGQPSIIKARMVY
jgi:hypothetical protein